MSEKTPGKERQRQFVSRRQAEGLQRVRVWVPAQHVQTIKKLAANLCRQFKQSDDAPA